MANTLVTTFKREHYDKYAKDMIDTFREFWPEDVKLVVYFEGEDCPDDDRVIWRSSDEIEDFNEWMESVSRFPLMTGKTPHGYDIQHDARHVRKALTEMQGCKDYGGKVWWIDGDFITHQKVPEGWLDEVLPDDKFCAYCGRENPDGTPWMYPETGFIGFNSEHGLYEPFMQLYREIFKSGLIFTQQGWHDCYGFDLARRAIGVPEHFVNLSKDVKAMHPIVNSVLGTYLDHKKGNRKDSRSTKEDLVIERNEPYWQV